MTHSPVPLHDLPALPHSEQGPVFNEPWEAHAFALAVRLSEAGCFSVREWSAVLSHEIRSAHGCSYYNHWLTALERLCVEKGLVNAKDMQQRKEEWRQAYLNTPHGQPIELSVTR